MNADDPRHGTPAGYNAHKRAGQAACDACKRGIAGYQARISWEREQGNPRSVPVLGAQRRIQALMAIGWSADEQASAIGWNHKRAIHRIRFCTYVYRSTHQQIAEMYERLSGTPGPSKATRTRAQAAGYAPPLAWDNIDDPSEKPKGFQVCTVGTCAGPTVAKGLCNLHYQKNRRAA